MPLGYIMTITDVMGYYLEREDIQNAFLFHGFRRMTVSGTDTSVFGQRGTPLKSTEQIAQMMKPALEKQLSAVPRKYPSFHAKVSRQAVNGDAPPDLPAHPRHREPGTDLIIDIDIKDNHKQAFEQGRRVLDMLDSFEVPYRVKFSGNASPHIILPADLFPSSLTGNRFQGVARKVLDYVNRKCRANNIDNSFDSPEHYLRMPYSLNENTGLVSVPIAPGGYDSFTLEMAEAPNVVVNNGWMDVSNEHRDGVVKFLEAVGVRGFEV